MKGQHEPHSHDLLLRPQTKWMLSLIQGHGRVNRLCCYDFFSMLNSTEHETTISRCDKNVKVPTFISWINFMLTWNEPGREKGGLWCFRPGPTQTRLYRHRRLLEAWNFGFRKKRECIIQTSKPKALISFAVTAKLICVFVFEYAKIRFPHVAAQMSIKMVQ